MVDQMKDCFDQHGIENILSQRRTYYEPVKGRSDQVEEAMVPCQAMQLQLGDCVRKNTTWLEERMKARKKG